MNHVYDPGREVSAPEVPGIGDRAGPRTEGHVDGRQGRRPGGNGDHPLHEGFDDVDLERVSRRPGAKWALADGGIAAWIADMDFPPCPPVLSRLREIIEVGDLGYPNWLGRTPLRAAFSRRMAERHGWAADAAPVREVTDLIQGVQLILHLATAPGDAVALHVPAYPPFLSSITASGRRLVPLPLHRDPTCGWALDPAATDDAVTRAGARVLILVNPHNPTGRVFTRAELESVAETARRHDLLVISDEIHADLGYTPHGHIPFASISPDAARRTVTLTSASKAFNLAGLRCAVMHVGDPDLLRKRDALPSDLFGAPSFLGVEAALAAWTPEGDAWLATLVEHLGCNRRRVAEMAATWPGVDLAAPDGTYLAWLDVRGTGLGQWAGKAFAEGGVRLSPGEDFGPGGEGFVRLNFATSAGILDEALRRMDAVLRGTAA